MAMTKMAKSEGGVDVDRLLNFEHRSGIKDGEIETFITKVDAVNAAIQAMKDGEIDPADVHVDGVPTIAEERQMEEEKRKRRLDLARRERENRERQKRDEHDKWWRGAELLYGDRQPLSTVGALNRSKGSGKARGMEESEASQGIAAARPLSEGERARLKERYSMEYSRWDSWTPADPATLAEGEEREEEEDEKKRKEFEESNPDFCKQMVDDMKTRAKASEKKDSEATAARLKGNRFYKAKRWEKALELYMSSLRARPYTVNTLANIAQTLLKLERWKDALDFCDRTLHVDGTCVKALSRRASAFVNLAGDYLAPNGVAPCTVAPRPSSFPSSETNYTVADNGGRDDPGKKDSITTNENTDNGETETVGQGEKCIESEEIFHDLSGDREGLMALALEDLDRAVGIDPKGEDVRRQRDSLSREMEEEKAEAEVIRRARKVNCGISLKGIARAADTTADETPKLGQGALTMALLPDNEKQKVIGSSLPSGRTGSARNWAKLSTISVNNDAGDGDEVKGEFQAVDKLLEEGLGGGRGKGEKADASGGNNAPDIECGEPLRSHPLLLLADLLKANSTARVYFRASGGLGRLAEAATAATAAICIVPPDRRNTPNTDHGNSPAVAASTATNTGATSGGDQEDKLPDPTEKFAVADMAPRQERIRLMLTAVAASLEGGERLAQQDVLKSGLLGGPCVRALWMEYDKDTNGQESTPIVYKEEGAAGAAAQVLYQVVDDDDIRDFIARSAPLLTGLVGLIGAGSTSSHVIETAARTLARIFLGRTAPAATKSLREIAATASLRTTERRGATVESGSIVHVVSNALLAWKEGSEAMLGAAPSVGATLCSVLVNLAAQEGFRGQFAESFSTKTTEGGGRRDVTPASVLVLVAGITKGDSSETRPFALSALANACLNNDSVQAATLCAGGLTLALAILSLEGDERKRHVPLLVSARSARLMARLSAHPLALEAMARPGVIERIVNASVRSAALGGNLYTAVDASNNDDSAADPSSALERQNLVHTLAAILRSTTTPATVGLGSKIGPLAPSSNVHKARNGRAEGSAMPENDKLKLAEALVSFLPPAVADGAEGITIESVVLKPAWCAPPTVTVNVCSCLLHLLDGEGCDRVAQQVVDTGGIPRLISLFANSGGGGIAVTARKNVAICLARLARNPKLKKVITDLRGMEMLIQAGGGLAG